MRIRTILVAGAVVAAPLTSLAFGATAHAATSHAVTAAVVQAAPVPVLSGGHATANNTRATVTWKCSQPAHFKVTITGPGKINGRTATVTVPKAVYTGLESGHTYSVKIQPLVNNKAVGHSGIVVFKTTRHS
jgi:hypothetical protein